MNGPLDGLAHLVQGVKTKRVSSYDKSGGNTDCVRIEAGETFTLANISGAGVIKHIWITLNTTDPMIRRNARIQMFWDGESNPSVDVPLGDFFGQGWGEKYNFACLPLAAAPVNGSALNCYFPMPFSNGSRIQLFNESSVAVDNFYYYVDYEEHLNGLVQESGRFHAFWNRQMPGPEWGDDDRENEWETLGKQPVNPSDSKNHIFVRAVGKGHYVGVNYYVDCPTTMWYGEGDDMFLVDGENWPGSLHGTGTEDYFNSSWCPKELYSHPFFGYARVNNETGWLGRTHCYRFHLADPIYFEKSLNASIEHGHANSLTLDLTTVAYWYQTEPHQPMPELPAKELRQPMTKLAPADIHKWRDSWRRELGGSPLWGNEPLPDNTIIR